MSIILEFLICAYVHTQTSTRLLEEIQDSKMSNIVTTSEMLFPKHKEKGVLNGTEALRLYMQVFRHYVDPSTSVDVDFTCLDDMEDLTQIL